MHFDLGKAERRRQHDAALCGGSGDLGDGQKWFARESRGGIDIGAATVGQQERPARAAILRDAIGITERKQCADRKLICAPARLSFLAYPRHLRPALCHCARLACSLRAITSQRVEAMAEIDIAAAEPALGEDDGYIRGELRRACRRRIDHHAREPRRQRQLPQPASLLRDPSRRIDRAERAEQRLSLPQRRRRR